MPDFSPLEASAREQLRQAAASLKLKIEQPAAKPELAIAYGEMGKLFMAAEYLDAAEACYLNAQALAPSDKRWPYYLGHLYRMRGPLAKSATSFERALQLQPGDFPTLVWLGEAHLAQGRADAADSLFAKALTLQRDSVSAQFGAGRAALAKRDHARAVKHLEKALALDPQATASHYPLAMAYRGLGDLGKAEMHLRQQGGVQILPSDPLMKDLDELLQSPRAYDLRGGRALEVGDWAGAAAYFRKGLELEPSNPSLRYRLATALFQMGDVRAAMEQFEEVVRLSPEYARAHYSLGVLMEASGRRQEAIDRFSTALKYDPGYAQARVRLAGVLRRSGRLQESLAEYEQVLKVDPTAADAAFGHAMTLVGLKRYQEARDGFIEGMKRYADQPMFAHALARLLAAAPDDRIRDGRRAIAIAEGLLKEQQTIDLGETMAMGLAEAGRYEEAAALQRQLVAAANRVARPDLIPRLTANLELYERRRPSRTPWQDDDWDLARGGS